LAALVALISGAVTCALGLATYGVVHEEIEAQIDHRIELEAGALRNYYARHGMNGLSAIIQARDGIEAGRTGYLADVDSAGRIMGYAVIDETGRRRAGTLVSRIPPPGWSEFLEFRRPDGSTGIAQALNESLPGGGRLIVAADRSAVDRMDVKLLSLFVVGLGAILISSTMATLAFGRLVRRRLDAIGGAARQIMAGDLSQRMPNDGSASEFDELSAVLNKMLDRIESLLGNLKQVSSDIAHDLRTPLTRLRSRIEGLAGQDLSIFARQSVQAAIEEIDDLLSLFSALLGIAEIEGMGIRRRFVPVRLDVMLAEVIEAYQPVFHDRELPLGVELAPTIMMGEPQLLKQILVNLLDNILAHATGATTAAVLLVNDGVQAHLTVIDDGPGIRPDAREWVFQRFTRLDAARSTSGHGLGLSMVRAIALAHGGEARIGDGPEGNRIILDFPLT
jgi:signal transduction histidine kinase